MRNPGLVMLLAFAMGLFMPSRAGATILALCEPQAAASMTPLPGEQTCEIAFAADDDIGSTSAAPMCDLRGLSIVAPPRILPISDARAEPGRRGCGVSAAAVYLSPGPRDNPLPLSAVSSEFTSLAVLAALPPPREATTLQFLSYGGAPRAGVLRDVFRPPRPTR